MSTPAQLSLRGAGVRRDGAWRLRDLTLDLPAQGITCVIGPNGAGKSLFLRLAMGIFCADAGAVRWGGEDAQQNRRARGFVFQRTPLLRRSVWANVAYPLHVARRPRAEIRACVDGWLARARLSHKAHDPAARLSGGEAQRLALARALVHGPQAVLLDEPSASLDPSSTALLEGLIHEVAAEGVKIVLSTHDVGQARRLAGDVVVLDQGRLAEQAEAAPFFAAPQSAEARAYLEGRL